MKPIKCECGRVLIAGEDWKLTLINKAVIDFRGVDGKFIIECNKCGQESIISLDIAK